MVKVKIWIPVTQFNLTIFVRKPHISYIPMAKIYSISPFLSFSIGTIGVGFSSSDLLRANMVTMCVKKESVIVLG